MNREGEGKIFARDSGFISGCPGRAPDLVFEIAGKAPDCHAMTLGSPWIRFASPAVCQGQIEIGLTSGLLWLDAALE